jgi:hypothetical protein
MVDGGCSQGACFSTRRSLRVASGVTARHVLLVECEQMNAEFAWRVLSNDRLQPCEGLRSREDASCQKRCATDDGRANLVVA